MKKNLIIFGNTPFAQLAKYYFDTDSTYQVVAFTVDKAYCKTPDFEGLPLIPLEDILEKFPPSQNDFFVAIGYQNMNQLRMQKSNEAELLGYQLASYISSKSSYLSHHLPGKNSFILEGCIIQPFVQIGNNVTVWSGTIIGHHSIIKDCAFFSINTVICGHCIIESFCFLGAQATIADQVTIAEKSLIGAGAVITKNTEPSSVYISTSTLKLSKQSHNIVLK